MLALVLLAAVPGFLLAVYTNSAWKHHDVKDTDRYVLGLARYVETEISRVIDASHHLLSGMARVPEVRTSDPVECPRILDALRHGFSYFANLGVAQPDGEVSCSAVPLRGPVSVRDRPYFREVMETRRSVTGDYLVGRITGKSVMYVAAPMLDGDVVHAVVFGGIDLEWFGRRVSSSNLPAGTTLTLVNRDGVILTRYPDGRAAVGSSALTAPAFRALLDGKHARTAHVADLDGVIRLMAFWPLSVWPGHGELSLIVGVPLAEAFAEADRVLFRNLVALGVAGVAALLLTWLAGDVLVLRRVRALLRVTERVGGGDLAARSGVSRGSDELSQLTAAFDAMAAELEKRQAGADLSRQALREANEGLERRVQERTADLTAANEAQQKALRGLERADELLSAKQAQLAGIIGSAMEAMVTVDADGRVIVFNGEAERIFRLPAGEAIGRPLDRFIPERFRAAHGGGLHALGRSGRVGQRIGGNGLAFARRADGEEFPVEAAVSSVEIRGKMLHTVILRDISERLRTEDMLRKLSLAVEKTAESVFITNCEGIIEYVNPAFERLTGFRPDEAIGRKPSILKSGRHDAAFYEKLWKTILAGEVFSCIFVNQNKTGETYYEEQTITPIRGDGRDVTHFVAAGRDVTERVRAEKELRGSREQLRALAAHLESVREEEQTRIAREIHDELGQGLTALKYDLAWMASRLPGDAAQLREKCNEMTSLTDVTVVSVRRIASELRPRLLDDLGLEPAVEWLLKNFGSRTGLRCDLDARLGDGALCPNAATAAFRIVQEALTNVARHATATSVTVRLRRDAGELILVVRDDGKGVLEDEVTQTQSLGILGMRERALARGGTFSISGVAGKGTTVTARFPLTITAPEMRAATHRARDGAGTA